jgi:23S rRNA (adenine2030-N6)-methyltransferase
MLSYRHAFHAGNFADVFKHLVLTLLVKAQLRKEKPFCYLDTHAGAGRYDLASGMARKNREYVGGIGRLWDCRDAPEEVNAYLSTVRSLNAAQTLRFYPGSPRIVRHFLRPGDRMILCDLHTTDTALLRTEFAGDKQAGVHHLDGYQGLKAFLPPPERRGLVLCDPAFELKDERTRLLEALTAAWRRWPTGVYAVWYPILDRATVDWFHRQLKRSGIRKVLLAELRIFDEDVPLRLNGSGMIVVNPPWRFDEQLTRLGPWLWNVLSPEGVGGFRLEWLVPE